MATATSRYLDFIAERLQPDLHRELEARDVIWAEIAEWLKLRSQIEAMQAHPPGEIKLLTDVGCDFYMQAKITKRDRIYVKVGANCQLEMTLEEALAFIAKKEKLMEQRAEKATKRVLKIKAHIKFVLAAVNEIQMGEGLP
ncbi:hypothetical protein HK101_003607 [Irineochytrium annulatum]|nr:hypothetical protein HK101_003607 [Irineochytrium annulatum]